MEASVKDLLKGMFLMGLLTVFLMVKPIEWDEKTEVVLMRKLVSIDEPVIKYEFDIIGSYRGLVIYSSRPLGYVTGDTLRILDQSAK